MTLLLTMFVAGMLTILLPCILPLIPIVLGVSVAGKSKWRPLLTVLGMVVSFVGFTFLLVLVLNKFVIAADYMRTGTNYILLLFGFGFAFHNKNIQRIGAIIGSLFFLSYGLPAIIISAFLGLVTIHFGGKIASSVQQIGTTVQHSARTELGADNPLTAFLMGLTMGLVWVPCAGPALGFAFTLVREQPGLQALLYLTAYGLGTALPLLIVGYGGQKITHSVRSINKYSGHIKQGAGIVLIATALALNYGWFKDIESWLVSNTEFGNIGIEIETELFSDDDNIRK